MLCRRCAHLDNLGWPVDGAAAVNFTCKERAAAAAAEGEGRLSWLGLAQSKEISTLGHSTLGNIRASTLACGDAFNKLAESLNNDRRYQ
jgi:hypothetical protein